MKYKNPPAESLSGIDPSRLPAHVAVIMDGNGRWAKKRSMERIEGHRRGVQVVEKIVSACRRLGIPYLTLYAFSTENWQRPADEVNGIMSLLETFISDKQRKLKEQGIRLRTIGETYMLPPSVRKALEGAIEYTREGTDLNLILALSYGSRAEITGAARRIANDVASGVIAADDINETLVASYLYTHDIPDPDLVIRTSGEMRLSNFLLWQLAYSEIYVTDTLWPDFCEEEFVKIVKDFQSRERRFGKV